jgi:ribose transport system permease protein
VDAGGPTEVAAAPPRGLPFWANPRLGLIVVIAALVTIFGSLEPAFFNERLTIVPLLADVSVFLVVGLAQLCVLSLGHMNLAVGRMAAISAFVMGLAYTELHVGLYVGMVIGLFAGAAIGGLAGLIIARTGVNSFVVTLALDFALLGLVTLLYNSVTGGVSFAVHPAGMDQLRNDTFGDYCAGDICGPSAVPLIAPFAIVAALVVGYVFRYTRLGRELLMTGSSERAAQYSGIPTGRRIIGAHAMSGTLAALAGFLLAVNNGAFSASVGEGFLLPSFLAPVLGGTLLAGGAVSVFGTVLGAALTQIIYKGLNLLGFVLDELKIYLGVVLILALSLDRLRVVLAERRGVKP